MIAAGRSPELIRTVENPAEHSNIPLPAETLELVLVDAYEAIGKPGIAEVHWNKVVRGARSGNRQAKRLQLAQWAERHRYPMRAIAVYRELLKEFPDYTPHWYDRIATLARQSDQLPVLREVTAELRSTAPENIVYQHNLAYLSALAGEDLDNAAAILKALLDHSPHAGSARCALALVESQRGNLTEAAAQLEKLDPRLLDPNSRFIYLTLSGKSAVPPDTLTPYELAALDSVAISE